MKNPFKTEPAKTMFDELERQIENLSIAEESDLEGSVATDYGKTYERTIEAYRLCLRAELETLPKKNQD